MAVRTGRVTFVCNRCGKETVVESFKIQDVPPGFHIAGILKIYESPYKKTRRYTRTPEPEWYCTKECLIDGIQYHNYNDVPFDPKQLELLQ